MKTILNLFLTALFFVSCASQKNGNAAEIVGNFYNNKIKVDTLTWNDTSRNRKIPVAFFNSKNADKKQKIVIFSHGYGGNKLGENLSYNYLTKALAANNYFVVSVQQELPTDPPLPMKGNLQELRRPSWETGADNILFVINQLRQLKPDLDFSHITLIGHSQGGDQSALFQKKYPNIVDKIITMDNRRMALPRTLHPKIYSLRASEFEADEGVIPTKEEQNKYKITIVIFPAKHSDMGGNQGTIAQKKQYIKTILTYLKDDQKD